MDTAPGFLLAPCPRPGVVAADLGRGRAGELDEAEVLARWFGCAVARVPGGAGSGRTRSHAGRADEWDLAAGAGQGSGDLGEQGVEDVAFGLVEGGEDALVRRQHGVVES